MRKLPPLKAIRARCVDCSENFKEIKKCPHQDCSLWPARMGKEARGLRLLKRIKQYCIWCMGDDWALVKECWSPDCMLYPYRLGKNPALQGKNKGRDMSEIRKKRSCNKKIQKNR